MGASFPMSVNPKVALTIAGTDSGGGAGVIADVRTFAAHGVWGTCAVTAVTAQNTAGVDAYDPVSAELVGRQIDSVVSDIGVNATKTGMLPTAAIVDEVARRDLPNLVVDPVLSASSDGSALATEEVPVAL